MKAVSKIFALGALFVFMLFVAPYYLGGVEAADDNVTVFVNISASAQITVTPTNVSWFQLGAGTDGAVKILSIINTGSTNLTNTYAYVTTLDDESNNPTDRGNATLYAAGGFLYIKNETDRFFHAGRLEWNLSDVLTGEVLNLGANTQAFGHGWYRNATNGNFYLWKAENGTGGGSGAAACNATDTTFTIKNDPENFSTLSRDFTIGGTTAPAATAANANWTTFSHTAGPLAGHCVAVYYNCTKIFIYKYDKRSALPTCTVSENMRNSALGPGDEMLGVRVYASIPRGTPAGNTTQSLLVITAT